MAALPCIVHGCDEHEADESASLQRLYSRRVGNSLEGAGKHTQSNESLEVLGGSLTPGPSALCAQTTQWPIP